MTIRPADPIDLAVAIAFERTATPVPEPLPPSRHQIARPPILDALGIPGAPPLTIELASIIFGFDQEAIEQPWDRLPEYRRRTYYEIAEAVLSHPRLAPLREST